MPLSPETHHIHTRGALVRTIHDAGMLYGKRAVIMGVAAWLRIEDSMDFQSAQGYALYMYSRKHDQTVVGPELLRAIQHRSGLWRSWTLWVDYS